MNTWKRSLLPATLLALGVATTAAAGNGVRLAADPFIFDPGSLGNIRSRWAAREGLPDHRGSRDFGLLLRKGVFTDERAAAGAFIKGVNGLVVDGDSENVYDFGFDIREDSHISAGSPRFNLLASDGFHFIGGAGNGDVVDSTLDDQGRTWYRIRFDAQDFTQAYPPVAPGATIQNLVLLVDEGLTHGSGFYMVDNIMVDPAGAGEVLIGKPGKHTD